MLRPAMKSLQNVNQSEYLMLLPINLETPSRSKTAMLAVFTVHDRVPTVVPRRTFAVRHTLPHRKNDAA